MHTHDQYPYTTHGYYSSLRATKDLADCSQNELSFCKLGSSTQHSTLWHNGMGRVQQVLKFSDVYY